MPDSAGFSLPETLSAEGAILRGYLTQREGHIVALSANADLPLVLLRVFNSLELREFDGLTMLVDPNQSLEALEHFHRLGKPLVLVTERTLGSHDLTFLVRQFKETYPDLRVIMLSADMSRERVMLLHEMGADICVSNPPSPELLLEKLAEAAKPKGRVGLLAHEAKTLLHDSKPSQALKICQKLLKVKPDSSIGYVLLGDALRQMNELDQARQAYEAASSHADMFLVPLKRLADMAREAGQTETRLLFLYRLDDFSPLNAERKMEMGEIHLELGQSREAERLFEKALQLVSQEASVRIASISERIASLYSEVDPIKAEKYWRHSLETRPRDYPAEMVYSLNRLGLVLRRQGRWRDALLEYRQAVQLCPEDSTLHYNMGMACLEGKDHASAAQHMSKALVLNPGLPYSGSTVAYNMGMAFLLSEHTTQGIRCMEAAIEQNPGLEDAHNALRMYAPVTAKRCHE